jgi:CHASE2 domain-containing sensor protein
VTNPVVEDTSVARAESRRFVLLCGLAPAILTVALIVYRPDFVARVDYRAYDILLRSTPTRPPDGRVAIVDIDDHSLSTIGQWPWRRDRIAQLIVRLREQGAAAVALDVMFAEADRYATGATDPSGWDGILAGALAEGRVVLGYALTFTGTDSGRSDCVLHPLAVPVVQPEDGAVDPLFHAEGAICSLPVLARAAGRSGFLNAVPDFDGTLRRVPILIDYGGNTYPSLALAAVLAATDAKPVALRALNQNTASLELTSGVVPLDGKSNLLVRYRGKKRSFPYVSAADVLAGKDSGVFKNAVVFVGTTALGSREVVSTPLDTRFAGVEVQATVADNLLRRDFLSRNQHALTLEVVTLLALGIAITLLVARVGLPLGTIAGAVFLVAVWRLTRWQLATRGEYLSPVFPMIGMMASLGAATVARIAQERRRADRAARETDMAHRLMVRSLLSLTEVRDADTGRHSRRIQQYSRLLAQELSHHPAYRDYLTPERIDLLSSLAPLHDIGKVGVPDQLLNKPGQLTPEEYQEMKKHPVYGLDVINNAQRDVGASEDQILSMAKDIVYTHHEWWDGQGYPRGIKGNAIPIAGRLVAVVDVYDAMTARRRYRQPVTHDEAVRFIVDGKSTHFDPDVVDAFVRVAPHLGSVDR